MPRLPDVDLKLVSCIDDLFEMKRWFGERREVLGLDTETTGIDPFVPGAKIRMIQIGDHRQGWAVPWEGWGGAAIELMDQWKGNFALHNAPFDASWLRKHAGWEMPWERTDDTYIMAQIERPEQPNDLKTVCDLFIDPMASEGQKLLKAAFKANNWFWDTVPLDFDAYWIYSALDPVLAVYLRQHFRTDKRYPETYDLEMSVRRICWEMEYSGMRVDLEYSQKRYDELVAQVKSAKEWAKENWGISIGSTPQLVKFFRDDLGAKFEVFSKTSGNPSVDKTQLELFSKSEDPVVAGVAKYIVDVRNADKMSSTYFKNFLEMNTDGLVHPTIRTMGARTGRMSVTAPALQTLPKDDTMGVRRAFVPRNEGDVLVSCDYSQVEMRLLAHFSGDPALQAAFKEADATGGDFFVSIGRQIYNDPNFSKKDKRRGLMKNVMYGAAYGSGIQVGYIAMHNREGVGGVNVAL